MYCHACKCHVTPVAPKTTWKILTVALWVTTLAVAIAFSVIIGINLVLMPMAVAIGMALGVSTRRMSSWTCPRCSAELIEPEPQTKLDTVPLA